MKIAKNIAMMLCIVMLLVGCTGQNDGEAKQFTDAYINGFNEMVTTGDQYAADGLQLQADYAYRWAYATVAAMRNCVDSLLYLKGEGKSLEAVVDGRLSDWDAIGALNYTSSYPWFFEGIVYHAQGKEDAALLCYEKAVVNPAFNTEYNQKLIALESMNVKQLKAIKVKLVQIEDKVSKLVEPQTITIPRDTYSYSDAYLRDQAKKVLESEQPNYQLALAYYKGALANNPFEGDNFAGCALMAMTLLDSDLMYFYVNEGLYVDPDHEGLNSIANALNQEVTE